MQVLVIPDVHLKPQMFRRASSLMEQGIADRAVCLMDLADDWDQQYNITLYEETYQAAIQFARQFPDTLWCYGNHDLSYLWHRLESGYSSMASATVQRQLFELKMSLPSQESLAYVQRIDNVLFSHAGVLDLFVRDHVGSSQYDDIDQVLRKINQLGANPMWNDDTSPIWARPQYEKLELYKSEQLLQVAGHTPMKAITRTGNLISCDVFSTYPGGLPIGTGEYLLLDTLTWETRGIKS